MKKALLFTLLLVVFLDLGNFFMPMPIFTPLFLHSTLLNGYAFDTRSILLGAVVGSYGLAQLFGAPILGEISDQYGRKKTLVGSMSLAIIGCILGAISLTIGSIPLIFASRILIGFASGTVSVVFAVTADNSTDHDRAKNLGYVNFGLMLGAVVGPIIGGYLSSATYAVPFYIMALLYIINMILMLKFLPPDQPLRRGGKKIHPFIVLHNLKIVVTRSRYLAWMVVGQFFVQVCNEGFYLAAPIIANMKLHMQPSTIANYFTILGISGAFTCLVINAYISRVFKNSLHIYIGSMFLYVLTIGTLAVANTELSFVLPFLSISIFGNICWIHVNNLFSQAMSKTEQGLVFGVTQAMWSIGGIVGSLLVGLLSSIHYTIISVFPLVFILLAFLSVLVMQRYAPDKI